MSVENKQQCVSLRLEALHSEVSQGILSELDYVVKETYLLRLGRLLNMNAFINPPKDMSSLNARNLIIKATIGAVTALSALGEGHTVDAIFQQAAGKRDSYKKLPR